MKYLISLSLCAILTGCWSTTTTSESLTGTGQETPIDRYADKNDLIMSRAAAAVQVARDANKNNDYDTVDNELGIASSYLPKPELVDLEFAQARAKAGSPEDYRKATQVALSHQKQLDDLWSKVEREKQKALDELEQKKIELKAEQDKFNHMVLMGVGGAGMLIGIIGLMLGMNKVNCALSIGGGALVCSLSWFFDSPYFLWIAGFGAVAFVIELLVLSYKKMFLTRSQEHLNSQS